MRVLLNGVGRIGKAILRIADTCDTLEIVAINELNSNKQNIAYSINYDSTYGRFENRFEVCDNSIINSTSKIDILNYSSLFDIDLKSLDIDIIIDATGVKLDTNELKILDTKAIFLTHPNKNADINVILGVNENDLDLQKHKVISTSSCNATALLPILKLIDDNYNIEYGDVSTIHPLLNHQKVLDSSCVGSQNRDVKCNSEFGRSATQNIIPSKTTTIDACSYLIPSINSDIFSSSSLRVPTDTVGVINVTLSVKKECTKESLLKLCKDYQANQKFDILLNNFEPLVSSDFKALNFTTILDHRFTDVKMNKMIKLVVWYDNEWGYASKVVDIVEKYKLY
ncbi:MAG: glyceraldehyde 3-phosphate dehydrogenase NAD-binding domain-containing protein [Campylobacterota bacterium]|nr:glyceraldehyde 3-phosphate dehydrogenase NAD-binding domain-containing protein [Campylobacterota bacterium]